MAMSPPAYARLGENLDQLIARYGPPSAPLPVTPKIFHKGGWTITVDLINGISAGEKFTKQGAPTDEEIATLLSLNSESHSWKQTQGSSGLMGSLFPLPGTISKTWQRDDGALATLTGPLPACLNIQSKELLDADKAAKTAQQKASDTSLQGF